MPRSNSEEWRSVVGYEGLYEVSSLGRVRSLPREVPAVSHGKPITRVSPGKMLVPKCGGRKDSNYKIVGLTRHGVTKQFLVHRLVGEAFIPNPSNLPCINHKDEDASNNDVHNLEWCTYKYNANYGTRKARIGAKNKGKPGLFGEFNPNYGNHISDEIREKMRLAKLGKYVNENSPNYGKHLSELTRKRISESQKERFKSPEQLAKQKENAKKGAEARWHKNAKQQ